MSDDEELQFAIALSKKTYEEEEQQRSGDSDLIRFDSPDDPRRRKQIEHIKGLYGFPVSSSSPTQHQFYYGFRRSLDDNFPVVSYSTPSSPQSPSGTFVPNHFAQPPQRPPKPPEFQSNRFPPSTSLTLIRGLIPPPPPLPPRSHRVPIPPRASSSTPLRHSTPSFCLEGPHNLSPIVQSFNETFTPDTSTSNEESTTQEHSVQYQPLTHLYVPYTMPHLNSSYGALLNGDLIDLSNLSSDESGNLTEEQIRSEFDPLYRSYNDNKPLPIVQLHYSNRDSSESTIENSSRTDESENDLVPSLGINLEPAPDPIEQQVLRISKRGMIQRLKTPNFFIAPTVDYMTTTANPITVVFHPDQSWGRPKNEKKIMTININDTIELMTAKALSWFKPDCFDDAGAYGLKIYGCNQFLEADSLLGANVYTGHCLLHGEDVELELAVFEANVKNAKNFEVWSDVKSQLRYSEVLDKEDLEKCCDELAEVTTQYEDAFKEQSTLSVSQTSQRVKQKMKMLCQMLHEIVPEKMFNEMQLYLSATTEEQMFTHKENFLRELHMFVGTYCKCTISRYMLPPLSTFDKPPVEVLSKSDQLKVMLSSIHRVPEDWLELYTAFHISLDIYYGTMILDSHQTKVELVSKSDHFFTRISIGHLAKFTRLNLNLYPKETRLVVTLFALPKSGVTSPDNPSDLVLLSFCSVPLYDEKSFLRQGAVFLPLVDLRKEPIIKPFGPYSYINNYNDPILSLNFSMYDSEVYFPKVSVDLQCIPQDFETLDPETKGYLEELIEKQDPSKLEKDDQEMIWQKRLYLTRKPNALPLVLSSLSDWSYGFLNQVYQILEEWTPLRPEDAMKLLLPQYPDERIRSLAVQWISRENSTDFQYHSIGQLVEALRFEQYEKCALADFLFELSSSNLNLAYEIYWQLEQRVVHSAIEDTPYAIRCQFLQQKIIDEHENPELKHKIKLQHDLIKSLDSIQVELRSRPNDSDKEKLYRLRARLGELDGQLLQNKVPLPLFPAFDCTGIRVDKCSIFNSNAKPLKIVFRGINSDYSIIHKRDDDMRQDALVMKLVNVMDRIWKSNGLDLCIITFRVMPVAYRQGMGELVLNCATLLEIQKEDGLRGVLNDEILRKWLIKHNSSEYDYKKAHSNFIRSCAAWCVVTYVLGIGDRHNDNILFTRNGHVFHIDFGKYMGDWQMAGGIKRDRVPFVFTKEMSFVINEGRTATQNNQIFLDHCCQALLLLRKHRSDLTSLLNIMGCSQIPGMNLKSLAFVEKNLMLNLSDTDAASRFTEMIKESLNSSAVKLNFYAHAFAQFMSSSSSFSNKDDNKLSFVPTLYTEFTDGRLKSARCVTFEKRVEPSKIYFYKIEVTRENSRFASSVYRSFAEFSELHSKLKKRFPSYTFVLDTGSWMRSNVRKIAQKRMIDVQQFLQYLFTCVPEVKHCDLVYSFFHSLLRDNEETEEMVNSNYCQMYLTIGHNSTTKTLTVFVAHVRNLALLPTNQAPDAYVKTYIRPDMNESSKRKTHVVRSSQAPTFNKVLSYENFPLEALPATVLDVSVWNKGGIENRKMYMSCIPLQRISSLNPDRKGERVLKDWFNFDKCI